MQKYIISILLITLGFNGFCQEAKLPERQVYIRGGIDISRFALPFIGDVDVSGFEVSLDTEIKYTLFPTVEFGRNDVNYKTTTMNYSADGSYFRLGVDYNMLKYQHRLDRNIFFIGIRYAYSRYNQQADNVIIENEWGEHETSFANEKLNHHWTEAIMGLRGEIFKNFFMGVSVRVKIKIAGTDYSNLTPYFVPGYGEAANGVNLGMSYSMFYAIPLKKLK